MTDWLRLPTGLTPGAERIVRAAAEAVPQSDLELIAAPDLLAAIFRDEGLATEILRASSLTLADLEAWPATDSEPDDSDAPIPVDTWIETLLRQAETIAADFGTPREIGSGFLLRAIFDVEPAGREWLAEFGLTPDSVGQAIRDETGEGEPTLDVDVRIEVPQVTAAQDVSRLLDACLNRAREALRTIEDHVRFVRDAGRLQRELKSFRHELTDAAGLLDERRLTHVRNVTGDVGRDVSTSGEMRRSSPGAVAVTACKRLQESLRSLEEFGKLVSEVFARRVEALRYRAYDVEVRVRALHEPATRLESSLLYLLVSKGTCATDFETVVRGAIEGGTDVIQLREKELDDRSLMHAARKVRRWTEGTPALFIMNDRPDIAVLSGADGVHVGQEELSVAECRRIVGSDALIGVSTHSVSDIAGASDDGADYFGVGPTFPSTTKPFPEYAGLAYVQEASEVADRPWFAIGGIQRENLDSVLEAGCSRVAVSGAICGAESPARAAGALKGRLEQNFAAISR